ncbi:MAG: arginine--tRNA ligase, partial [Elusimicrobiota bacterium]
MEGRKDDIIRKLKKALATASAGLLTPQQISLEPAPPFLRGAFDLCFPAGFLMSAAAKSGKPIEHAKRLAAAIDAPGLIVTAGAAAPAFVNIKLAAAVLAAIVHDCPKAGVSVAQDFELDAATPKNILLEFCSANPTGPLHFGHARGSILSDTLARIFTYAGVKVTREYYINDIGGQIDKLGASVLARFKQEVLKDATAEFPQDG